jgi:peptidoglycan hydrolase-like protein with peptidoglycan-binding domain
LEQRTQQKGSHSMERKEPRYGDVDKKPGGPVRELQQGLKAEGFYKGKVDGKYFDETHAAVNAYRKAKDLEPLPYPDKEEKTAAPKSEPAVPSKLEDLNILLPEKVKDVDHKADPTESGPGISFISAEDRRAIFGSFKFSPYPAPDKSGYPVKIHADAVTGKPWESINVVRVFVPQLKGIIGADGKTPEDGFILLHRLVVQQFLGAMQEIEKQGLLPLLLTFDGTFYPRYQRGSDTSLSNHTWSTACDFNAEWNQLGKEPAAVGEKGSVRLLVPIFEAFGFYWGGYFSRKDGMHFEAAKVVGLVPQPKKS